MKNSKTFRLFISSTFNDFREERKVLQTKVFPIIKKHCSEKGYRFQPIDLRWGISNEAQLDQKTLELCLDEVKTCKSYPNPNFLVMLGDRYGWIPLPYIIEQKEFEEILKFSDDPEKSLLKEWYQLDKNQLPASYILKQREGKFRAIVNWNIVENTLLKILQNNSNKASLTIEQKRKYFTSATEAEIEEGIIPYLKPTAHQSKLLSDNLTLEKEDTEYIFGFFRNIEINSKCSEKFITDDFEKAQKLKTKVKEVLLNENVLEINTTQINKKDLDYSYLESFENKNILFLKQKLENQIKKETKFTKLEIEKQEQEYFAKQKRQNFIGQEHILKSIKDYIKNDNQQAFVLYGKSGSGKSSIIAKAISEVKEKVKVVYRFVGATSNSSSSTAILISIFNELGITIDKKPNETFEKFSARVNNEILTIDSNVIIFIDAVDQLTNSDQFLWLPHILPKNVKIIISALDDTNYQTDSTYFKALKEITSNLHLVEQFNEPEKLLLNLLKKENRALQKHQLNYFLNQYNNTKTPLYVYVASQEIKHWKSFDLTEGQTSIKNYRIQGLANSQSGIIQEFIKNLSDFFHHDKRFVRKILAYIYASTDGLSEDELLELLNTDKEFIRKIAPDTWHINTNKELPLVIWTRLYTQLKPFLSRKNQDNEELLYFFHREFGSIIKREMFYKEEHQNLIKVILNIIEKKKEITFFISETGFFKSEEKRFILAKSKNTTFIQNNEHFHPTRFPSILYESIIFYELLFKEKCIHYITFIKNITNEELLVNLSRLFNDGKKKYHIWGKLLDDITKETRIRRKYYIKTYEILSKKFTNHLNNYFEILQDYSFIKIKEKSIEYAIRLQEEALKIVKQREKCVFWKFDEDKWLENYIRASNNLAVSYETIKKETAVKIRTDCIILISKYVNKEPTKWLPQYYTGIVNLSISLITIKSKNPTWLERSFILFFEEHYEIMKKSDSIYKIKYLRDPALLIYSKYYLKFLNNLSELYFLNNDFNESLRVLKKQYEVSLYVNGENEKNTLQVKENIKLVTSKL